MKKLLLVLFALVVGITEYAQAAETQVISDKIELVILQKYANPSIKDSKYEIFSPVTITSGRNPVKYWIKTMYKDTYILLKTAEESGSKNEKNSCIFTLENPQGLVIDKIVARCEKTNQPILLSVSNSPWKADGSRLISPTSEVSVEGTWVAYIKQVTFVPDGDYTFFNLHTDGTEVAFLYIQVYYREGPAVATPTITLDDHDTVTINCNTAGASLYYTTDGTEPTIESTKYEGPFIVSEACTVKALAVLGNEQSSIGWGTLEQLPAPTFTPAPGTVEAYTSISLSLSNKGDDDTIRYTLDGSTPDENSEEYSKPFAITETTIVKAKAYRSGWDTGGQKTNTMISSKIAEVKYKVFAEGQEEAGFNFANVADLGNTVTAPGSSATVLENDAVFVKGPVRVYFEKNSAAPAQWVTKDDGSTELQIYSGSSVMAQIIEQKYKITNVELVGADNNLTCVYESKAKSVRSRADSQADGLNGDFDIPGEALSTSVRINANADQHISAIKVGYMADDNAVSGIETVMVDSDAQPVYYDLSGRRVEGSPAPGLYIVRQGEQTLKVFVK